MARSCKAHTTKTVTFIKYLLRIIYGTCTLEIIVRRWFWTSKDVYWGGYNFLSNRGHEKAGGHNSFLWKIFWSQLSEINKRLLGGYKFHWNLWSMTTPPCKFSTFHAMWVALLVYNNTAASRGWHTIFDYQIRGSQKYCRGTFGNLWNPIPKYGDLIVHLFMCFLINQILRNNDFNEI